VGAIEIAEDQIGEADPGEACEGVGEEASAGAKFRA
jgi:hypothetical protein